MRAAKDLMPILDRLKSLGFRHWEIRAAADVERGVERQKWLCARDGERRLRQWNVSCHRGRDE
jgi:hypothetical protein